MRRSRKPWSAAELAALAATDPRERRAAIARHAQAHGRTCNAVSSKLTTLRARRLAPDIGVRPEPAFPHAKFRFASFD